MLMDELQDSDSSCPTKANRIVMYKVCLVLLFLYLKSIIHILPTGFHSMKPNEIALSS